MNPMLLKLKKAIDRAMAGQWPTREIALAEFPGYVIKSLEVILADKDEERATRRLALLKAQVDGAWAITKQTAGAAEDLESVRVQVAVFEEPGLTAKPAVEQELRITGAKRNPDDTARREEPLKKAVESLQHEVAELKRALGMSSGSDAQNRGAGSDVAATSKDAAKGTADVRKDDAKKGASAASQGDQPGKSAGAHEPDRTPAAKQEEGGTDDSKAATKKNPAMVGWPLDMNTTMASAEPVTKADAELDWGPDPDLGPRAA